MYFKQRQSAPTNSISCGRPLPNFPLLYFVPSLSLLLLHFHSYPLCAFSLLSDIDFYLSSLLFFPLLTLKPLSASLCCSHPEKAELLRIIATSQQSHSVSCLAMPETFRISPISNRTHSQWYVRLESKVD